MERDERARELDLAAVRTRAAEEVFQMLEGLWKNDAVPRIVYLRAKYDRDIQVAEERHARDLLARQEGLLEQYRTLCAAGSEPDAGQRERLDEAYERYRRADCDARADEIEISELELAFRQELFTGLLDLEKNEVISRSQVILSRRDVEIAERSLEHARQRRERCEKELVPPRDP